MYSLLFLIVAKTSAGEAGLPYGLRLDLGKKISFFGGGVKLQWLLGRKSKWNYEIKNVQQ